MSLVVPCRSLMLCDCDAGAGGGFLSVFPPPVHPLFPPPGVCLCIPILRVHVGCTFPLLVDTWKWVEIWRRICVSKFYTCEGAGSGGWVVSAGLRLEGNPVRV